MRRAVKHRLYRQQRAIGAVFLLVSLLALWMAYTGETPAERDCTALLLTAPLGLYLLTTRKLCL